jgi:hypothetical protein
LGAGDRRFESGHPDWLLEVTDEPDQTHDPKPTPDGVVV